MGKFILTGFGDEIAPQLETQLQVLKKNGIRWLDLRSADGKNLNDFTLEEAKLLKNRLDDAGFSVSCAASMVGKTDINEDFPPQLEQFRRVLEVTQTLEAPFLRVFSFYMPQGEKPETYRNEVLCRMSRLCDEARGRGVRLLHENELGLYGDTPERCLDIAEVLGEERIGLIFDPANFINLTRRVEIYPYAWHLLKNRVEYMHIKDAVHIDDTLQNHHEVRPAGMGEGRIAEILRELDEEGYEGFLSVEPHLGYFPGLELLERNEAVKDMPQGGPTFFTAAATALQTLIRQEKGQAAGEKARV